MQFIDTTVFSLRLTQMATRTAQPKPTTPPRSRIQRPRTADPFDVKRFCRNYQLVRPDLTRLTGYSQRSVDKWAAGDEPGPAAKKQLRELVRLFDALADLMESRYVGEWLKTPNEAFDGSTPLQVIERGENDRIWRMIYRLETGEPV
jgi:DNA-binding transcriptional regulator YiaG